MWTTLPVFLSCGDYYIIENNIKQYFSQVYDFIFQPEDREKTSPPVSKSSQALTPRSGDSSPEAKKQVGLMYLPLRRSGWLIP